MKDALYRIPHGGVKRLSQMCGVSEYVVRCVLRGDQSTPEKKNVARNIVKVGGFVLHSKWKEFIHSKRNNEQ